MADVDMAMGLGEDADALSEPLIQEVPTDEAEPMQGAPPLPAHDVLMRIVFNSQLPRLVGHGHLRVDRCLWRTFVSRCVSSSGVCPALVHIEQGWRGSRR